MFYLEKDKNMLEYANTLSPQSWLPMNDPQVKSKYFRHIHLCKSNYVRYPVVSQTDRTCH